MNNKRLTYFDLTKGFGILFVVLGHIEYISEGLRGFVYSFHMPLFFIVSGMLIAYKCEENKTFDSLFTKKVHGILIPYLWFSLLYFIIDIMNLFIHKIDLNGFIRNAIASVTFYGVSVLWFLPALFIGEIIAILLLRKVRNPYISLIISFALADIAYLLQIKLSAVNDRNSDMLIVTSLINIVRVLIRGVIASCFVLIGYVFFKHALSENKIKSSTWGVIGLSLFVANILLCRLNGCIDIHYIILNNVPLFFICATIGSVGLILMCVCLADMVSKMKYNPLSVIEFFGINSLTIMATHIHCYVLYAGLLIAWQIDTFVTRAKSYVFIFNIMLFTMLIECIIVIVINRFFPFVLGKKKNK